MKKLSVYISPLEPHVKDGIWARPYKEGFVLYLIDDGKWKPVRMVDSNGTISPYDDTMIDEYGGVKSVTATIDDNVGIPSVNASLAEGIMSIAFSNLKGNGIENIQTLESQESGGVNIVQITCSDGSVYNFNVKNGTDGVDGQDGTKGDQGETGNTGPQGPQGDSAVYDPSSPDTPDFVMANTTGQSTTKAMTQKAVSDNIFDIKENAAKIGSYDNNDESVLGISDEDGNLILKLEGGHVLTKNFNSDKSCSVTEDNSDSEVNVGDDEGNVILQLKGGHIKTKKFDSRNIATGENDAVYKLNLHSFRSNSSSIVEVDYVSTSPFLGVEFKVKLPSDLRARIAYGATNSLGSTTTWCRDGETITLPQSAIAIRPQFSKADGSSLTTNEVEYAIENGEIELSYVSADLPIEQRNQESSKKVFAAMFDLATATNQTQLANIKVHCLPTFVHVSDVHGDAKRLENALEFSKLIQADGVCVTGDSVMYTYFDGSKFQKDALSAYDDMPLYTCIGNHECLSAAGIKTNTDLFEQFISPYVEQGGYKIEGSTPTTQPYYFVDNASQKIRIITINQFDNACYGGAGEGGRIGQVQATWLCNTLLSTPTGYGVIILMHSPEDAITIPDGLSAFNQSKTYDGSDYAGYGMYCNSARPIEKIVDGFISRTAISFSYIENTSTGNNGETVIVEADFSSVDSNTEFLCYLTGHRHRDRIGYNAHSVEKQVVLNITCSNAHYARGGGLWFSNESDLPRQTTGIIQDSFNVYAIDRFAKRIIIVRVGSDTNMDLIERKVATINYKD